MKATTERSINLSPFLFGDNTTPITIVWLCALTFIGLSLLWFWSPHSFGKKQRKLKPIGNLNVQLNTEEDSKGQNKEKADKDDWAYDEYDCTESSSERQIIRRLTNSHLPESKAICFGIQKCLPFSDGDIIVVAKDRDVLDESEINNNLIDDNMPPTPLNANQIEMETVATVYEDEWKDHNVIEDSELKKMAKPHVSQQIFTQLKFTKDADIDNETKPKENFEDIQIPSFKDYLFDLRNCLPVKTSDVKKLGFYISWKNGIPNFYEIKPFDPLLWVYSEPTHLPLQGNLNLEVNFPEGPNEYYNNLTQELKYMRIEELRRLARSLHLPTFSEIDVIKYRIRKTYELQINAMETRKASMTGWVPNFRQYQQMYPTHGKGWFDYVVVVDFECTCEEGSPPDFQNEIIQFPAVLIDTKLRMVIDEFNVYVKPTENPNLTEFCTNLTGITQETVNNAPTFSVALQMFTEWLKSHGLGDSDFTIVTDGPTDMGKFLLEQCQLSGITYPAFATRWINIRKVFSSFYGIRWFNLKIMMNIIGMPFEGSHHNGADDAKNIATIFLRLLHDGCLAFQNEQIVLDKALQSSNYHNRSFYLNSVIPFNQYPHNPYAADECRYGDSHLGKEPGSTYFYLPEIFSTLGNKENVVMQQINCDSGKKQERKLFNVVTKMTGNDTGASKSKSYSPAASRS